MSSALNTSGNLHFSSQGESQKDDSRIGHSGIDHSKIDEVQQFIQRVAAEAKASVNNGAATRNLYHDVTEKQPGLQRRDYLIISVIVIALHIAGVEGYIHSGKTSYLTRPKKSEVVVEFFKPEPPPPPVIEPPKPPPPKIPPKVQQTPPPRPTPALRTPPAEQNVTPSDMTVKENTEAPHSSGPVVAEAAPAPAPPAPPPPPKEEPVTEATGRAGYLNNPAPDYPAIAQRQGWEGKVVLRVRVLANGTASSVEVKQSSGRKVLDDAAVAAVRAWLFSPSKRGNTPIDGWATVPIEFRSS